MKNEITTIGIPIAKIPHGMKIHIPLPNSPVSSLKIAKPMNVITPMTIIANPIIIPVLKKSCKREGRGRAV